MIRKFLNWLFGKKQETNKYTPLPTLNDVPVSHMAVSVDTSETDQDWHSFIADAKFEPTHSIEEVKTETTHSVEEPKAIHNHKPKRKYHKKKHKH